MSAEDKPGKKAGKIHECKEVTPGSAHRSRSGPSTRSASRPDFDAREEASSPKRKAAGPAKKRRRGTAPPAPTAPEASVRDESGKEGS